MRKENPLKKLLPDQLKELWKMVDEGMLTQQDFQKEQERLVGEYARIWEEALLLDGHKELPESLITELCLYLQCEDRNEIKLRCLSALTNLKNEWHRQVKLQDRASVEQFYNQSEAMIYELMWWHSLLEDNSPLAYVAALEFGEDRQCRSYLDFGAGVGSGAILCAHHGLEVTLADISSPMLALCKWRFKLRNLPGCFVDIKSEELPVETYDFVSAMDVFEHLTDPVETVEKLNEAIKPGGFIFGRFHSEVDEDRPHHIIQDFSPTIARLKELGFEEAWRDDWLWGHQVFQKADHF